MTPQSQPVILEQNEKGIAKFARSGAIHLHMHFCKDRGKFWGNRGFWIIEPKEKIDFALFHLPTTLKEAPFSCQPVVWEVTVWSTDYIRVGITDSAIVVVT